MRITVLGSGAWGWAIARALRCKGNAVTLWATTAEKASALEASRRHPKLGDAEMPEGVCYTADLARACSGAELVVFAVASAYVRETAERTKPWLSDGQIVATAAKGIEKNTLLTMSGVLEDVLAPLALRIAAISGPTHAEEVSRDMPTCMVCACADRPTAELLCDVFTSTSVRTYPCTDLKGVELCGALKNIIALAAGIAKGLGYGDNALAALITRGMSEIRRLGLAMGCESATFDGLAGIGDLIVTCFSGHSRNRNAGLLIGGGMPPGEAIRSIGMVVEGVYALDAAMMLAERYHIALPIVRAVNAVIHEDAVPEDAAAYLMTRGRFLPAVDAEDLAADAAD